MDEGSVKKYIDIVVERIGDKIDIIAEGHQMLADHLKRHDQRFDDAEIRMDRSQTEMRTRFDKMDDRFDKMDDRFDKMDDRFDKMDDRFDRMDGRFDRMDDRFDKADKRFDSFQAEVRADFSETKSMIKLSYSELDRRMTTLERHVHDLISRVERIEADPS